MTDINKQTETQRPEDATDKQLEEVAGGNREGYRDENGDLREGMWGDGYHYHRGHRGRWNGAVWVNF